MNLSEETIRARITSKEVERAMLDREHNDMVKLFRRTVAANQKRHAELSGAIDALQELLEGKPNGD